MSLAPIALFIYRRPEHTRRTLDSLLACPELLQSPIYIYCDGAKSPDAVASVREARAVARALAPKHAVFVESEQNRGLATSIIAGVTDLCQRFGRVIVVEDDLEVAPGFLCFLNAGLDRYDNDALVMQVSAYQFPLQPPLDDRPLFLSFPTSWGWATWQRAWQSFDAQSNGYARLQSDAQRRRRFDLDDHYPYFAMLEQQLAGRVDSWAIRWRLSVFDRDGLVLYPGRSLVRNIGFDGSGTHGAANTPSDENLGEGLGGSLPPTPTLDLIAQQRIFSYLADQRRRPWSKHVTLIPEGIRNAILSNAIIARSRNLPATVLDLGRRIFVKATGGTAPDRQDLDVYWDPKMAEVLDTWGLGNAWNEIELLLANVRGSVVDIACGTGKVMSLLAKYPGLELHGFDISDFLLQRAKNRGIAEERLRVSDATKTEYPDNRFDFGYSIGSLEHFTDDGIFHFAKETHRITRIASFHMIPVSRSGKNEGWMKTVQSFHNNSVAWWLERFHSAYPTVHVLESAWNDRISLGKWFLCMKEAG